MTPQEIAKAWHSVTDEWIDRRNKAHDDGREWEVVHNWGGNLISDDTMKVVGRFATMLEAENYASQCEDEARGAAVLRAFEQSLNKSEKA